MSSAEIVGIIIIFFGVFVIILGLILRFWRRPGSLGRLPGDINIKRRNVNIYLPVITSLLISLILTIILNLILWSIKC